MGEKDKVDAYINLYKQQMDRFGQTRDIEWKGNFGIWGLLAGAIYLAAKEHVRIALWVAICILAALWLVHLMWLLAVHASEHDDKERWNRYRSKALDIMWPGHGEGPYKINKWGEIRWLLLEAGITAILSCVLVMLLQMQDIACPPGH
jgi:hypothetical protein